MSSQHERESSPEFAAEAIPRGDVVALDFGSALAMLKVGAALSRINWNGPDQYIRLQRADWASKMTLPYFYIRTVQGDLVPWLASQTDLLAHDWYVVDHADMPEEEGRIL